ncbi:PilZ domain-containing protein [Vibrio pectenicida]|uniref:PilZ domain-containing protein n=1 Tax=Vibrio pectenicida TaxID=62763 RepID=A0A427TWJ7_9VIBR|nr:PilZ domain-containing protein [Vibrio pectenicida]RSD28535.1 PilZ domain-containing protein [Vibrio pectenicida]
MNIAEQAKGNIEVRTSPIELEEGSDSSPKQPKERDSAIAKISASICFAEDAFLDVMTLCDVMCVVYTPTGKALKCRTKYIGCHSSNALLLEMPMISPQEKSQFIRPGYSIKAYVISSKGEGARVCFKSKIECVLSGGDIDLLFITLPKATQVIVGLRESVRLDISLNGILDPSDKQYPCQIRDISQQGCLIVVDRGKTNYRVGSLIRLKVLTQSDDTPVVDDILEVMVQNATKTSCYMKYGVKFEDKCLEAVCAIIEGLHFCSLQQKFMLGKTD